jgi:hypothetical protein
MIDPGALGTLLIGLDAIEAEARLDRPQRRAPAARRPRPGVVRLAVARALHRVAAALEQPAVRREST